jgi:hypothetical protein
MSTGTTTAPDLPIAPVDYSQRYQDALNNVLRLYFAQLDNPGLSKASGLNLNLKTLPTQALLTTLRSGDVYVDTSAGYVLKVKP